MNALFALVFAAVPLRAQEPHHMMMAGGPLKEPGSAAFAAVQETVAALEADPKTDWTRVDLEALRKHLVDMDNVTLRCALASKKDVERGAEAVVRCADDAAKASLDRVLAAHPPMLAIEKGWELKVSARSGDAVLVVTGDKPADVPEIRALAFIGWLAAGAHHQAHHWAIANGRNPHAHHHGQ